MVATTRWSIGVGVVLLVSLLAGTGGAVTGDDAPVAAGTGGGVDDANASAQQRVHADLLGDGPRSGSNRTAAARAERNHPLVEATVLARSGRGDSAAAAVRAAGGHLRSRYGDELQITLPRRALTRVANASAVRVIRPPVRVEQTSVEGLPAMRVERVHDLGYDGANATVAVVDTGGFDLDNPAVGDQVVTTRDFTGRGIEGGPGSHGTKTAELLARTAPGAEVVLVRIRTTTDLKRAVDWLGDSADVDVVSMSLAWANTAGPLDGTDDIDRKIGEFVADGGVWFTSAGNYADGRHWNGTWRDSDGDDVLDVAGGESLAVQPPTSGSADVFLSWDDWDSPDEDYDLLLVGEDGTVLDRSTNTQDGATFGPWERVTVDAGDENPRLRIVHRSGATDAEFDAFTFGRVRFDPSEPRQSLLIPAASPDVISVGAVGYATRQLRDYSSRGPTVDGRLKPDLVAPDGVDTDAGCCFYGTSAAAPHAAGVAALALDANRRLSPAALRDALRGTTTAVRDGEPMVATGWGLVNATGALAAVERVPPVVTTATLGPGTDRWVGVGDALTLTATATDAFGVAAVRANASAFDAGTVTLTDSDGDDTFEGTVTVGANATSGPAGVTVTAVDRAGNTDATATTDVRVDAAAPTLAGLTLTDATDGDGTVGAGDTLALAGTVADEGAGVDRVRANASVFGAGPVTLTDADGDGTYDATVSVDGTSAATDGEYGVSVTATDAVGNARSVTTGTMELDTPPGIRNLTVANPDGRAVAVAFESDEALASITVHIDGPATATLTEADFSVTDGRYLATWAAGTDGGYTATVDAAVDASGKDGASDQSDRVVIDTTAPTLSEARLTDATDGDGLVRDADAIAISVLVSDATTGVASVSADAAAFGLGTVALTDPDGDGTFEATVSLDGTDAPDGDYAVPITATDGAGNRATLETGALSLDTPPGITNLSVRNPAGRRVAVAFDASESLESLSVSVVGPVTATLTEANATVSGGRYVAEWTADVDGVYTATLDAAVDASGLDGASGQSGRVTIDTTAPDLSAPTLRDATDGDGIVGDGHRLTVAATVADVTAGLAGVTADFSAFGAGTVTLTDGDGDGTVEKTVAVDARAASPDGTHAVEVTATDAAGNQARATTGGIPLDTTPPSLTVDLRDRTDGDGQVEVGDRVAITATATDATTAVAALRADASALGAGVVTLTDVDRDGTATATVTVASAGPVPDGPATATVIATDAAGNEGRATTDALVVDSPPTIREFSVTTRPDQRVAVEVGSSEPLGTLRVRLDGATATNLSTDAFSPVGATTSATYRAVHAVGRAGSVTATLVTAADATGHDGASGQSETVSIDAAGDGGGTGGGGASSGGGGGGGGSGGGGGGSSGGGSSPPSPPDPGAAVRVVPTGPSSAAATVSRADTGETVTLPFGVATSDARLGLDRLSLSAAASRYDVSVTASTTAPDGVSPPPGSLGFLTVAHSVPDAKISDASIRFRVDAATLTQRGLTPSGVTLLRRSNGTWTALPTAHNGIENGTHRFAATSPGLSVFAVATPADLSVTNATLNRTTAVRADPVGVTVTVENRGAVTATRRLNVTANGTRLASETVRVPAGSQRTVTLPVEFVRTGTYALAIDGTAAGTVRVAVPVDTHESSDPVTTTPVPTTESGVERGRGRDASQTTSGRPVTTSEATGPGFSAVAGLIAVVIAGLVTLRRRF